MTEENQSSAVRKHNNKWRVVDIVVAAIIAVASGVIFWGWDIVCTAPLALFEAVTPGFEGLLNAFWLFAGPLAAIIVRKPGAALFAETLAAALELTMGNQWGVGGSLIVGIVQGLGAEIGLAIFAYKKWDLLSTTISGALAGVGCGLYYWLTNPAWSALRVSIYLIASAISGAVLAGAVMYLLQVAIAKTGVLDFFFATYVARNAQSPIGFLEWVDTEYNRLELHSRFREEGWASLIVDKVLHRE